VRSERVMEMRESPNWKLPEFARASLDAGQFASGRPIHGAAIGIRSRRSRGADFPNLWV
jgi:hypothetical protein